MVNAYCNKYITHKIIHIESSNFTFFFIIPSSIIFWFIYGIRNENPNSEMDARIHKTNRTLFFKIMSNKARFKFNLNYLLLI